MVTFRIIIGKHKCTRIMDKYIVHKQAPLVTIIISITHGPNQSQHQNQPDDLHIKLVHIIIHTCVSG